MELHFSSREGRSQDATISLEVVFHVVVYLPSALNWRFLLGSYRESELDLVCRVSIRKKIQHVPFNMARGPLNRKPQIPKP